MSEHPLSVIKKSMTKNFDLHVQNHKKQIQDCTGATATFYLATKKGATPTLTKAGSLDDATNGVFSFSLTTTDTNQTTGAYHAWIKVILADGTTEIVDEWICNIEN